MEKRGVKVNEGGENVCLGGLGRNGGCRGCKKRQKRRKKKESETGGDGVAPTDLVVRWIRRTKKETEEGVGRTKKKRD